MDLQKQLGEWYPHLKHVFDQSWMIKLGQRLGTAKWITPSLDNVFRAFSLTPPDKVKVVIIGQDPYIKGEADGLAFSSFGKSTPSLEVIMSEINRTHKYPRQQTWLDDWAEQGVLLLNAVLTTEMEKSKAHEGWGWEQFTQEVFKVLRQEYMNKPLVVMLWGKDAQTVAKDIRTVRNQNLYPWLILKAPHPQAQNWNPANKFVGCNHFLECNKFLILHGLSPIWWADPMLPFDADKWIDYITYLNGYANANIDLAKIMHSYPAVPDFPHPYDPGLRSDHRDTLPF